MALIIIIINQELRVLIEVARNSGADNNLFPAHMGEAVGIDIFNSQTYGQKRKCLAIDTYRVNNVKLIIGYEDKTCRLITVKIDFSFSQYM